MKTVLKGFDPELGQKFARDHAGLVIARAKKLPKKSEEQLLEEVRDSFAEEFGRAPDAQEEHDWAQELEVRSTAAKVAPSRP